MTEIIQELNIEWLLSRISFNDVTILSCDENDWFSQSKFLQALTTSRRTISVIDITQTSLASVLSSLDCSEEDKNILATNVSLSFLSVWVVSWYIHFNKKNWEVAWHQIYVGNLWRLSSPPPLHLMTLVSLSHDTWPHHPRVTCRPVVTWLMSHYWSHLVIMITTLWPQSLSTSATHRHLTCRYHNRHVQTVDCFYRARNVAEKGITRGNIAGGLFYLGCKISPRFNFLVSCQIFGGQVSPGIW